MRDGLWLAATILAAYGLAFLAGSAMRRRGLVAIAAVSIIVPALAAAPLLIASDRVILRAIAAFVCTDLVFRLIDYYRESRRGGAAPSFRDFCGFLLPFPVLWVVYRDRQRRSQPELRVWVEVVRSSIGATGVAAGFVMLDIVAGIPALHDSFLVDHLVKVAIFLMTIESASEGLLGLERLAGFDPPPLVNSVYLSRTVAEFWFRYNTRVHRWLYKNVFLPSGGRRAPVRGMLMVFFISAALHELAFDIATSSIDGYQFIFFMIQAPAVFASRFVERLAKRSMPGALIAHALTIAWMTATSVFFFHGVNRIFPFLYVSQTWPP
jgi:hypothetical protein